METINNIELRDESIYPNEPVLQKILGKSYESYLLLLEIYDTNRLSYGWRYYHDGKAWLCKVQLNKRTIVWMSAWSGYMQATIYFPEKYFERVYKLDISEDVKNRIKSTKCVGKSKPCIFEVRGKNVHDDFTKVLTLKIDCK
jgi:hypothetical protein